MGDIGKMDNAGDTPGPATDDEGQKVREYAETKAEFDKDVAETAELTKRHYEAPILLSKEQQSILETKKVR